MTLARPGWVPQGPTTQWTAQMKPIIFAEYGFATVDRCTNQPNVFFDPKSTESETPFWSVWNSSDGETWTPRRDDFLANLGLQTIYDYWSNAANVPTASSGPMVLTPFCCAWNWDARPFPTFPLDSSVWGDTGNWPAGNWIGGKGPYVAIPTPDAPPGPGSYPTFPTLLGEGWSVHYKPRFQTRASAKVSGRETRAGAFISPLWDIELTFDILRSVGALLGIAATSDLHRGGRGAGDPLPVRAAWRARRLCRRAARNRRRDDDSLYPDANARRLSRARPGAFRRADRLYQTASRNPASAYSVSILPATITFVSAPAAGAALTIDFHGRASGAFRRRHRRFGAVHVGILAGCWIRLETVRA